MLLPALLTLIALQQGGKAVTLNRVFADNEKYTYDVKSHITLENRARQLETFLPQDYDMTYTFTAQVKEMKTDGIAVIHYQRPTVTETQGETYQRQPESKVTKTNFDFLLTVSPINEILEKIDIKSSAGKTKSSEDLHTPFLNGRQVKLQRINTDLRPNSPPSSHKTLIVDSLLRRGEGSESPYWQVLAQTFFIAEPKPEIREIEPKQDNPSLDQVAEFVHELYRLALFNGPLESSLDFAPELPFNDVKPGDTWKRTVGYTPQQLQDNTKQSAVQRLDYTYTYRGPIQENGRTYERVTADLNLNTDVASFANQYMQKGDLKLAKMPMTLKATIEFNLDPKTYDTINAHATSQGGFQVYVTSDPNTIYFETKLKGSTSLNLRTLSTVQPK